MKRVACFQYQAQHRSKMSGHADTQAVLERIQVSMMQGTTKQQSLLISSSSTVPEKGAETTVSFQAKLSVCIFFYLKSMPTLVFLVLFRM